MKKYSIYRIVDVDNNSLGLLRAGTDIDYTDVALRAKEIYKTAYAIMYIGDKSFKTK